MNTARFGQASAQMSRGGLVVAGGKNGAGYLAGSEVYGFATMATDKPDYSPGSTVTMTGTGWKPGEYVTINVTALPVDQHNLEYSASVPADASGRVQASGFHIDESHLGMKFLLTATGSQSIAQMTFSDGPPAANLSLNANPASPQTAPVTVTFSGTIPSAATGIVYLSIGGSATGLSYTLVPGQGTFTFANVSVYVGTNTLVEVDYIPAVTETNYSEGSATVSYTVYAVTTTTTLSASPTSGSAGAYYGQTVTLNAAVSGATTPTTGTGTVTFYDGSTPIASNVAIDNTGHASTTINTLTATTHSLSAVFTPTAITSPFSGSTGLLSYTVNKAAPVFALTIPSSVTSGAPVQIGVGTTPAGNGGAPSGTVTLVQASSAQNGQTQTLVSGAATFNLSSGMADGSYTVTFTYSGDSNFLTTPTASGTLTVTKATPVVTVTTNPAASIAYGTGITYTATVSAPSSASASGLTPTGTVTFTDGTNTCTTVALTGGVAPCTPTTPRTVAQSPTTVTATYNADGNFATASGTASYSITQAGSSTTISSNNQTAPLGTTVTYTATVTLTPSTLTGGTVTFTDNVGSLNCANVALSGTPLTATCTPHAYDGSSTQFGAGAHTITATYNPPNANIAGSSANLTETINATTTTTTLTGVPGGSIPYGQAFTLTGTVTPTLSPVATGAIQFLDGSVQLATCTLSGSPAACSASVGGTGNPAPAPGATHSLTAKYVPDTSATPLYAPSTSAAQIQTIVQATTTVSQVSLSSGTLTFGSSATLSTTLTTTNPVTLGGGAVAATGTITFKDGSTVLGTATVNGAATTGTAYTLATSALLGGPRSITATYNGDTNYAGAGPSTAFTPTVTTLAPTNTLTVSPLAASGSQYGQPVTLTSTLTGTATPVPTNAVQFKSDGGNLGSAITISGNVASTTVSNLSVNPAGHSLVGSYLGDTNYTAVDSQIVTYPVSKGYVSVSVSPSAGNTTVGTAVTLSSTLNLAYPTPAGGTPPNGCVVVFTDDQGNTIGNATVTSGLAATVQFTPTTKGTHTIKAQYCPAGTDANYQFGTQGASAVISVGGVAPTVTLGPPSTQTVTYGQQVTFNASVAGPAGGAAFVTTDVIRFFDGTSQIGSDSPITTAGVMTPFYLYTLAPGTHTITAQFIPGTGENNYANASSTSAVVTVNKAPTSVSVVTEGPSSPTFGQTITLSTTLSVSPTFPVPAGTTAPTGTITFKEGSTILGTAAVTGNCAAGVSGACLMTTSTLLAGTHNIAAYYGGDTNYVLSDDTGLALLSFAIGTASTSVALSPVPSGTQYGQPVALTATITPGVTATPAPTGTVVFKDAGVAIGGTPSSTVTVAANAATLTTAVLGVGNHTLTGAYSGDSNYGGATSPAPSPNFSVGKGNVSVSISPSSGNTTVGSPVTLNATLNLAYPTPLGGTAPTGCVVVFTDSLGNTIGNATVTNGTAASVTFTPTTNGTHSITGQYCPAGTDANYQAGTAGPAATVAVGGALTTTTLISPTATTITYGQQITFNAQVTGVAGGSQFVVGSDLIRFFDGTTQIGSDQLIVASSGATPVGTITGFSLSSLAPGSHTISARFVPSAGDTNYAGSTSTTATVVVNKAVTALSPVVVTTVPATYFGGASLTFTTKLSTSSSQTGTAGTDFSQASGTVRFYDQSGSTLLGSATVSSAPASPGTTYTYVMSTYNPVLTGGSQNIVATYSGDTDYAVTDTTASPTAITVNPQTPNYTLTASPSSNDTLGSPVTFTFTVTPLNSAPIAPGGGVTFKDGTTVLGTGTSTSSSGVLTATLTTSTLAVGNHNVTAILGADANYNSVTGSIASYGVGKANVNITAASNLSTASVGQTVTLYATVSPATSPWPFTGGSVIYPISGQVTWTATLGSAATQLPAVTVGTTLLTTGANTVQTTWTPPQSGNWIIIAAYNATTGPDPNFNSSGASAGVTVNVGGIATATALAISTATPAYGQDVTFTATVTPSPASVAGTNQPTPIGTVQIFDGTTPISGALNLNGTSGVNSAYTTFTVANLAVGSTHSFTAIYTPGTQTTPYGSSTSPAVGATVSKAITVVTIPSTSGLATYGSPETFSTTLSVTAPGATGTSTSFLAPTGVINFIDSVAGNIGSATLGTSACTGTATNPTCSIVTSVLAVSGAAHQVSAQYVGDSDYLTSSSAQAPGLAIAKAPIYATVSTTPGTNAYYGQSVTFSVVFTGQVNGTAVSGGTVDIIDAEGTICASVATLASAASCTTAATGTALAVGPHTVTIVNFNDPNYVLATLPPAFVSRLAPRGKAPVSTAALTVAKATTSTTLAQDSASSAAGQTVTFTATIAVTSPEASAGTPALTGTVTFTDTNSSVTNSPLTGCTSLGLTGNVATCAYKFTTASPTSHNVTATYSGDTDTATSSASVVHSMGLPVPTFALTGNPANTSSYGNSVVFGVTVTGLNSVPPVGTVNFYDTITANLLGSATLAAVGSSAPSASAASITVGSTAATLLAVGNHAIYVTYVPTGDLNYSTGTSTNMAYVVAKENAKVSTIAVSPTSSGVYSQSMTFTVTVAPNDTGNLGVPTGSITFFDGTTSQTSSPITLSNVGGAMTASVTISTLNVATHSITATYNGDSNFNTNTSNAVSVQINKASTTTTVSPITAVNFGQTLVVTAKVVPVAPAAVVTNLFASGDTITFYDSSTNNPPLGSVVIDATGTATLQVPVLLASNFKSPLEGSHTIVAVFTSLDTNYITSQGTNTVTFGQVTPTVTVTSSVNPSVFYQSVTLTAVIQPPAASTGAVPTGTVTFYNNGNILGSVTAVANVGYSTATLVLPSTGIAGLPVGTTNVISANYAGDANYNQATSPTTVANKALVQVVNQAGTTVSLTSDAQAGVATQTVNFTAYVTVTPPGGVGNTTTTQPTGNVTFFTTLGGNQQSLGSSVLQTVQQQNSAPNLYKATFALTPTLVASLNLTLSSMQVTAYYSGDGNYLNNTSPVWTQALNRATTTINVTSNLEPSIVGQAVTFTATVAAIPPATGYPTGIVQFLADNNNLNGLPASNTGSTLSNGIATFTTSALSTGTHAISAVYLGDSNFQTAGGEAIPQIVNKIPDSFALTASSGTAVVGQPVTFTATLSPTAPTGVAQPSGQATLMDGSNVVCVANVLSGVATFSFPGTNCVGTLIPGNHNLQAVFPGDNNWTSANSSYLSITITPAVTNTTIASSITPSVYGQPVTFTVTTAAVYPSTSIISGSVQLFDNAVGLGNPASISNGSVQITIPALSVGTHNIIATYAAGTNFGGSSSATLTQIVNKAPTSTTLAVSPSSTQSGSQIVLTAVVAVPSPGSGTPTGNVVFTDTSSNTTLGTVAVSSVGGTLTASLTTNKEAQASAPRLIVATYSGDGNFAGSASTAQAEIVNGTAITVVDGASYGYSNFAPDSWAAIYNLNGIVTTTLVATQVPLPTSLAGVSVTVTDSAGLSQLASLLYVSPTQINFLLPTTMATGLATVTVNNSTGGAGSGVILVTNTAPGIFTANQSGLGVAAAYFLDNTPSGTQTRTNTAMLNSSTGTMVANPLTMVAADTYAVELYGTGLHYAGSGAVTATINGQAVTVLYAGPQPVFAGLDQIDLLLPASLKGAGGPVTIIVSVNGQAANTVTVNIN